MTIRRMNVARLTAAAAGALLLLSACGGSSSSSSSTDAPAVTPLGAASAGAAGAAGGTDLTAYRQCMSDNGVTLPDFAGGGGARPSGMPTGMPPSGGPGGGFANMLPEGVDQETFDAAQTACASLAPQGGGFGQRGPGDGARVDETALAAYKSCLTDHEVTVADGADWMASLDRTDPTVQSAMGTCAALLPAPEAAASATASPAT